MGGCFGAKTFCRLEADRRRAGAQGGPAGAGSCSTRDEVFVTLNRHPARFRMRLGARRDGTFVGRRVWAWWDTGAYADTGPNVAAKGGWAARRPVPLRPRRGRLRSASTPTARRPAPSAATRPRRRSGRASSASTCWPSARRSTRWSCDCATCCATASVLHRRGAARLPRRGVPRGRRRAHRLARGPARQGPVRADEGHADAEPLRGGDRARRGRASSCARRPPRSARAPSSRSRRSPRRRWASSATRSRWARSTPTSSRSTRARRRAARRT